MDVNMSKWVQKIGHVIQLANNYMMAVTVTLSKRTSGRSGK